ncbi:MAG: methylated-DNA--[protein]-cysteine S-methyltransferase [Emergencia sp.]
MDNNRFYISEHYTPLGRVYMAADEIGLVGLWFENQKYFARILGGAEAIEKAIEEELSRDETCKGDGDAACDNVDGEQADCVTGSEACHNEVSKLPVFEQTRRWLDIYFEGREPDFTPPLHLIGTDFRKEVWDILKQIPYGQTKTYGEIAEELAARRGIRRMSAQAVGGAVGHNNISIIVPCHRVIGADGSLTGYAGGTDIKAELLRLEGAQWKA